MSGSGFVLVLLNPSLVSVACDITAIVGTNESIHRGIWYIRSLMTRTGPRPKTIEKPPPTRQYSTSTKNNKVEMANALVRLYTPLLGFYAFNSQVSSAREFHTPYLRRCVLAAAESYCITMEHNTTAVEKWKKNKTRQRTKNKNRESKKFAKPILKNE